MSRDREPEVGERGRPLAKAWWSLALLLPSVAAAFLVGESIPSLLGAHGPASQTPWWVMIVALGAASLVLASPLLLTARLSARASALGIPGAWLPVIMGGAIVMGFVVLNLSAGILVLVTT